MELKTSNNLRYYVTDLDVRHGIFTRHGGVSLGPFDSLNLGGTVGDRVEAVRHNHQLMYQTLDVNAQRVVTTWQVHGADVVVATHPIPNRRWVAHADGIITNRVDMPLVMRFADCTPILYHDPVQKVIGMAHAGWRGTVQGMAKSMVQAMEYSFGTNPADLRVVIGPSISIKRFQVGEEVVQAISDYYGDMEGLLSRDPSDNTAYVDLWEANRRDLWQAGVRDIQIMGICTAERIDDFYSHRAEKGRTGRFGAVISL